MPVCGAQLDAIAKEKEEIETARLDVSAREAEIARREAALLEQSEAVRLGALAVETATQQQKVLEEQMNARHAEAVERMAAEADSIAKDRDHLAAELAAEKESRLAAESKYEDEIRDLTAANSALKGRIMQSDMQSQMAALTAQVESLKHSLVESTKLAQERPGYAHHNQQLQSPQSTTALIAAAAVSITPTAPRNEEGVEGGDGPPARFGGTSQDAYDQIQAFLESHEIRFVGPGQAPPTEVELAWSVDHPDEHTRELNHYTVAGLGRILLGFPHLRTEVHGETGNVRSAPAQLAAHLGLDAAKDVQACMDVLASRRAQACLDALVAVGVPREQLFVTYRGRGGQLAVDFIPHESAAPPTRDGHAAPPQGSEATAGGGAGIGSGRAMASGDLAAAAAEGDHATSGSAAGHAEWEARLASTEEAVTEEPAALSVTSCTAAQQEAGNEQAKPTPSPSPAAIDTARELDNKQSGYGVEKHGADDAPKETDLRNGEDAHALESAVDQAEAAAAELTLENEDLREHLDSATATTTSLVKKMSELTKLLQEESAAHSETKKASVAAMLAATDAASSALAEAGEVQQTVEYARPARSDPSTASTPRSMTRELEDRQRCISLAKQELAKLGADATGEGGSGQAARPRLSAIPAMCAPGELTLAAGEEYAPEELSALATLAHRRSDRLKSSRAELQQLAEYADELLALPQGPLSLSISLSEMSVIPSVIFDAITCIALGTERVIAPNASFNIHSAAVDEVEVELWDSEASQMIGCSTFSIMPLLNGERATMDEELDVAMPGGPSLGSIRVLVECKASSSTVSTGS